MSAFALPVLAYALLLALFPTALKGVQVRVAVSFATIIAFDFGLRHIAGGTSASGVISVVASIVFLGALVAWCQVPAGQAAVMTLVYGLFSLMTLGAQYA